MTDSALKFATRDSPEYMGERFMIARGVQPFQTGLAVYRWRRYRLGRVIEERRRRVRDRQSEPRRQYELRQRNRREHHETSRATELLRMLPPRQAEIVGLIARGLTYEQVGRSLGISLSTVRVRLCDMRKSVHQRAQPKANRTVKKLFRSLESR